MEGRRRVTLHEQMSASESSRARELAGLTLDDVLANQKRHFSLTPHTPQPPKNRTLLDIIKDDETNKKDRRSWKAFKDKLRLKRAGSAWTSSIDIPTSDVPVPHPNSRSFTQFGRRNSVRFPTHPDSAISNNYMDHQVEDLDPNPDAASSPPAVPSSTLPAEPFRRGRVVTFRDSFDDEETNDEEKPDGGRTLSAREAVAAQEAAEAAAQAEADEEEEEGGRGAPVMSLMDLLEETDREMGLEGSRYILSDDDDDFDDDDDGEGDDDETGHGSMEHTCCICLVRHKAAAFIPCGHTFCRMCSRELMVSRGNCPLCNNFILEVLEIF
ncbi:uncharacterized protein LOC109807106 [Cajanus cajan]|uniref:uncharacterized protein LOC109807106 n=1 Tax=Cajanus cajan TaxID=3821 RepID=UPI00098D7FBA|nr:uncharacterized protein LOC109807106 [Cajanus cajan]